MLLYIYILENEEINGMDNFKTFDKDDSFNEWISVDEIEKLDIRPEIIKTCYNIKNFYKREEKFFSHTQSQNRIIAESYNKTIHNTIPTITESPTHNA